MIKITELLNGLRFFHLRAEDAGNRIATVLVVKSGSFFEPKNQNGISHLLEHLLIDSKSKLTPYQNIFAYLTELDATFNATIRKEYAVYFLDFPAKKMRLTLNFLETLLNLDFSQNDLEKEKKIICEEIDELRDNSPKEFLKYLSDKEIFKDNPFSNSFYGEKKAIDGISQADLKNFYLTTYQPQNMVLGLMSNQKNKEKILSLIRKDNVFSQKNDLNAVVKPSEIKFKPFPSKVKINNPASKRSSLLITILVRDTISVQKELLLTLLSNTLGRMIFEDLREAKGLIYDLDYNFYSYFNGPSVLEFYTECNPNKIDILIKHAKDTLNEINLDIKIFNKEKRGLIRSFEEIETFGLLEWMATRILFKGRVEAPNEIYKILQAISFNNLKSYYKKFVKIEPIIVIGTPPKIKKR